MIRGTHCNDQWFLRHAAEAAVHLSTSIDPTATQTRLTHLTSELVLTGYPVTVCQLLANAVTYMHVILQNSQHTISRAVYHSTAALCNALSQQRRQQQHACSLRLSSSAL